MFPLSRSLEVKSPAEKLFSSADDSYSLTNPKLPIKESDLATAKKGPFVLGAAATIGCGANAGRVVVVGSSNWMGNHMLVRARRQPRSRPQHDELAYVG